MGLPAKNKKRKKSTSSRIRKRKRDWARKKYAENAEYRERAQAKNRAYYRRYRKKLIAQVVKTQREKCEADPKYREKRNKANRVYYNLRRDEINALQRLKWSTDPDYRARAKVRSAEGHRRRKYGMTLEDYRRMVKEQDGRCAMCKRYFGEALRVDHCHRTGRVRRLLCHGCNVGFGFFCEDANALRTAADYSEEFNGPARDGEGEAMGARGGSASRINRP
jgi:hypothetical protein